MNKLRTPRFSAFDGTADLSGVLILTRYNTIIRILP